MGLFRGHSSAPLSLGMMLWGSEYFERFSQWRSPSLEFLITDNCAAFLASPRKKKPADQDRIWTSSLSYWGLVGNMALDYIGTIQGLYSLIPC